MQNNPAIWMDSFPKPVDCIHKYDRGHAVILGSEGLIGATRLAAAACSRIGAGLVTVLSNVMAPAYRVALPADIMVRGSRIEALNKVTAVLGGPGGVSNSYRDMLYEMRLPISRVFDAEAIPKRAHWNMLTENDVLTPHSGEFENAFGPIGNVKREAALMAAKSCGAIVVLKGPETIIAHPDGRHLVHSAPNPYMAKAGTGDVLAGFITGLLAQGMPAFEGANAAVWMHSECGTRFGPGLTACDLEGEIPGILRDLLYV